jgi:type IV pilus assembly protein PilE
MKLKRQDAGFTLIELVVAMAIVGILTAIAIPSYNAYIKRANRTDATRTMTIDAQALERCYSQTFKYSNCAGAQNGTVASAQGYYNVTIVSADTPASYQINAVAIKSPQTTDSNCANFTLDNSGKQGATNTAAADTTKTCWGST